jgi:hypothetical protein
MKSTRESEMHLLKTAVLTASLISVSTAIASNPPPAWITGHWCLERDGSTTEELWLPPHGGLMIGLGRTRNADETSGFEYLRITDADGAQSFMAQPYGNPPITFSRTAGGEHWVRFENPDHDFPQRIEYRREGDSLLAEIGGVGENGEETAIAYDYVACSAN